MKSADIEKIVSEEWAHIENNIREVNRYRGVQWFLTRAGHYYRTGMLRGIKMGMEYADYKRINICGLNR